MEKHTTTAKSKITRRNYSRISGSLELPNLVEIQTNSYKWFKEVGIKEVFDDIYPITNFNETLSLEFVDCAFDEPKYSVNESKDRDANYAAPIRATLRLINSGTGEIKEQEVFMGDFPLMTDSGTFIINGAERVIVSQLVRSPGAYFADAIDKSGKTVFEGSIIPSRGTWLEFENDAKDVLNVRIDRNRKIPGTVLLRALGLSSNEDIIDVFGDHEFILNTLAKDNTTNQSIPKVIVEDNKTQTGNYNESGTYNLSVNIANLKLKDINVNVIPKQRVVVCGNSIGAKLYTNGVLIVGMSEIEGIDKVKYKPYENTGIEEGDMIVEINNKAITCTADLIKNVNKCEGKAVSVKYIREGEEKNTSVLPVETANNEYKLGLWVRDAAARSWNYNIL